MVHRNASGLHPPDPGHFHAHLDLRPDLPDLHQDLRTDIYPDLHPDFYRGTPAQAVVAARHPEVVDTRQLGEVVPLLRDGGPLHLLAKGVKPPGLRLEKSSLHLGKSSLRRERSNLQRGEEEDRMAPEARRAGKRIIGMTALIAAVVLALPLLLPMS